MRTRDEMGASVRTPSIPRSVSQQEVNTHTSSTYATCEERLSANRLNVRRTHAKLPSTAKYFRVHAATGNEKHVQVVGLWRNTSTGAESSVAKCEKRARLLGVTLFVKRP